MVDAISLKMIHEIYVTSILLFLIWNNIYVIWDRESVSLAQLVRTSHYICNNGVWILDTPLIHFKVRKKAPTWSHVHGPNLKWLKHLELNTQPYKKQTNQIVAFCVCTCCTCNIVVTCLDKLSRPEKDWKCHG